MKLNGRELKKSNSHLIVIPRVNEEPIVLTAQAVLDYNQFETLCPDPKPPTRMKAGGEKLANYKDPRYILAVESHSRRRMSWLVLESLRLGSPDLTWDTIDYGDPNTWERYEVELRESGFNWAEIGMIVQGCLIANSLDESKIEEARASFLASREVEGSPSSFQEEELSDMPSGEPVST